MSLSALLSWIFFAYSAILPFAHTTALRNIVFLLLLLLILYGNFTKSLKPAISLTNLLPRPLIAWILFLAVFPILSKDFHVAVDSMRGGWGMAVLAWCCGLAVASMVAMEKISLIKIINASACIVFVYFFQLILALSGIYGEHVSGLIPASVTINAVQQALTQGIPAWGSKMPFPFLGYDEMHGNLGYAGSVVIAISCALFLFARQKRDSRNVFISTIFIAICFLSAILISSRGAVLFDLVILILAVWLSRNLNRIAIGSNFSKPQVPMRRFTIVAFFLGLAAFLAMISQVIVKDERWQLMAVKMQAGWLVDDPVSYICHGIREEDQQKILERLQIQDPAKSKKIADGFEQDAGRVLLLRVGWQLVTENPMGIDGSRQSYEKAIFEKCGGKPTYAFSHAHNGWLNMALSLGWLGAALYCALLVYMAQQGLKYVNAGLAQPWSGALFLVALFWLVRGLTDACYQDHYLQMQGAVLGYLYLRSRREAGELKVSPA